MLTTPATMKKKQHQQQQQQLQQQQQQQQQVQQQMELEQEITAATAALLGDESTYRLLDESTTSGSVGSIYPTQMTFMIGAWRDHRDEERSTQADEIHTESLGTLLGNSTISGRKRQGTELEDSRSGLSSSHCDGFFVSVTDGFACVGIRKYFMLYGLSAPGLERPTRAGISLKLHDWCDMILIAISAIGQMFPSLACARACYEDASHRMDAGKVACSSCNPFKFANSWSCRN